MRWVKETVRYWCDDMEREKYLGQGICAAILDTGVSLHPDLAGSVREFRDFAGSGTKPYDDSGPGAGFFRSLHRNGAAGRSPDREGAGPGGKRQCGKCFAGDRMDQEE